MKNKVSIAEKLNGIDGVGQKSMDDKATWYRVGDRLGLRDTDCFQCPDGFSSLPEAKQVSVIKSIVAR